MSISIANAALDRVEASPIGALSERNKTADLINRHLPRAAEMVLRQVFWSETTTNQCLDRIHVADDCFLPDGFCYAFALPKDFIRAYQVHEGCPCNTCNCNRPLDYRTKSKRYERRRKTQITPTRNPEDAWRVMTVKDAEGHKCRAFLAPCPSVQLEYVCMPDDLDSLQVDICIAIEYQLALRIATPLKVNQNMREAIQRDYDVHMRGAELRSTGQDQEEIYYEDGELLDARNYIAGW